jgi:hypothetical protein
MASAAHGAAIVAELQRRDQMQVWEDLIADALYDHELGVTSHRRQAEAVLATLLQHGAIR